MKRRRYPSDEPAAVTERVRRWRHRTMERLREQFGGVCGEGGLECGTIGLEFAHTAETKIRGRGRGSYERIRDIKAHPESYRLLCRRHHMDLDYNGLDPWEPRTQRELEAVPF